ncbi:MAG: SDR family NAD(P)-dependent oxidoreductase [Planctomycetaceae bacterium]
MRSTSHYFRGDVSIAADRERMIAETRSAFGRLDVLVNNAGITSPGRKDILDADEASFDRVIGINLKGGFFLTQLAANWMIEQRRDDPESECVSSTSPLSPAKLSR